MLSVLNADAWLTVTVGGLTVHEEAPDSGDLGLQHLL